MQQKQTLQQPLTGLNDEMILVVPRKIIFAQGEWQGIQQENIQSYIDCISQNQHYQPRSRMEQDPTYKQIIPYMIFRHNHKLFVMQRKSTASEQRLANKLTLGIGGHVRQDDMTNAATIFDWARREFHEEVSYSGAFTITTLGLINDDSNAVGQVHMGVVLLLEGSNDAINVKSELKSGTLYSTQECISLYDRMETWSQYALNFLQTNQF